MRFLLLIISLLFSFIFYLFSTIKYGESLFGSEIFNTYNLVSLSPDLRYSSIGFLLISFLIFIYFSLGTDKVSENNLSNRIKSIFINFIYSKILRIFIYFIIIFLEIIYFKKYFDFNLLFIILFWFFNIHIFIYLILLAINKIKLENRKKIKYLGLFLNFLYIIISFIYIYLYDINIYILSILAYSIGFNYLIHKKYTNYICLFFSLTTCLFLLIYYIILFINLILY